MKRLVPLMLCVAGLAVIALLMPWFNAAQPKGARITRAQAREIADDAAKNLGIPVGSTYSNLTWDNSAHLDKEFAAHPELRPRAESDPTIGPRLGSYRRAYYRPHVEKFVPWGDVNVDAQTGSVLGARMRFRPQDPGASLTEAQLRPRADAIVQSRTFRGAPSPRFESARPNVLGKRTDWVFRYRVATNVPLGNVVPYLNVYFAGDRFAGWTLSEEYANGMAFYGEEGGNFAIILLRFALMYVVLIVLLAIFLKKYHAGEAGIGTASLLFVLMAVVSIVTNYVMGPSATEGNQMADLDALSTTIAQMVFKFVVADLPLAVTVFFAWSVGESYARERWGDHLASFDAILRKDPINLTVGRSVLNGVLTAPAIAAASFVVAAIPLALHIAHADSGPPMAMLYLGGPLLSALFSLCDAMVFGVVAILFCLAFAHRKRFLPVGIIASLILGAIGGVCATPIAPAAPRLAFGFGGIAAAVAIFLGFDLLTTVVAIFTASLITMTAPLLSVITGALLAQYATALGLPIVIMLTFATIALMTKREIVYAYEDLAPHVKRIVERERVKAEIDAANRIQAALLPFEAPKVEGASVASHYRAATEIGGDYFDFLPQPGGDIGIAFGDVSGHGLTSGIVMAMAKAALLVQVDYDASPCTVMNVLNEIVIKTAPRRILMTFFFGLLDPRTHTLRFSSAGHLDPYVFRAATGSVEPLSAWGFPLGVRRREPFREQTVEFEVGDRLVLYSDGLIEAIDDDGEPFGFDRFEQTIAGAGHLSAEEIKKSVLNTVRKFTHNRPPEDDQTLVVVSFDEIASAGWRAAPSLEAAVVN